jgi:hypothetical protein
MIAMIVMPQGLFRRESQKQVDRVDRVDQQAQPLDSIAIR